MATIDWLLGLAGETSLLTLVQYSMYSMRFVWAVTLLGLAINK
jgi:hypothetical protein